MKVGQHFRNDRCRNKKIDIIMVGLGSAKVLGGLAGGSECLSHCSSISAAGSAKRLAIVMALRLTSLSVVVEEGSEVMSARVDLIAEAPAGGLKAAAERSAGWSAV